MNCRRYRACLMGVIAVALVCGLFFCIRQGKENKIPSEGTLVERRWQDEGVQWA